MRISWGWKIGIMYGGFVALIMTLVISSSRQHFDLVAKDYYAQEIAYQDIIDAGKNQSAKAPLHIHANSEAITITFPDEFKDKIISGNIHFYAPVDAKWDQRFDIATQDNSMVIARSALHNTRYTIKASYKVAGKRYYQESEIILHS